MTEQDRYFKRIKYFSSIISESLVKSLFFNAIRSFMDIEYSYKYRPEFFNYQGEIFLEMPLNKAQIIINNIEVITEIAKTLIPAKYKKYEHLIVNKLTSNWWIHEFMIDKYWRKDDKKKAKYLQIALSELFTNIEQKDIINFKHETYPYGAPWGCISYPLGDPSEKDLEYEKHVYKEFFRHFSKTTKLPLQFGADVKGLQTDRLNTVSNISNKLENYRTRITYTNLNNFQIYKQFKKFYLEHKDNSNYKDLLYSIFYFEMRKNLLWNTTFFLPAKTFVDIYDRKIKDNLFDKISNDYRKLSNEEASYVTKTVIKELKKETRYVKEQLISGICHPNLGRPNNYGEYVRVADDIKIGKAKIKELEIGQISNTYQNSFVSRLIKKDIIDWVPEWSTNIKVNRILNIIDHSDVNSEGEEGILIDIKKAINAENLFFTFCKLSKDGQSLNPILEDNYESLTSNRSSLTKELIRILYPLGIFDRGIIKIFLKAKKLPSSNTNIDEIFKSNEPLFKPITKEWYRLETSEEIGKEDETIPVKEFDDDLVVKFSAYLIDYINKQREDVGNEPFSKEIAPSIEFLVLKLNAYLKSKEELSFLFLSRFAKSLQEWETKSLFSMVSFVGNNRSKFDLSNFEVSFNQEIVIGLNSWFKIAEKKVLKDEIIIRNATNLVEKLCQLDIEDEIKSSLLSASLTINIGVKNIKGANLLLEELFKVDKSEEPYLQEADIFYCSDNIEDSISPLKKAIELFPNKIEIYNKLGRTYRTLHQYPEEIMILLDILSKFKDSKYSVLCKLSVAYLHNGQMKEAEQTAKKAIKLEPDDLYGYISLWLTYNESNQYTKEITTLLDILSKFKDSKYSVLCKLSVAYLFNGQIKEAEQSAKKAIKMKPDDIDGYYSLWFTYSESNQYTKEIMILLDILSKFKDSKYSILCKLSVAYLFNGQIKEAEQTAKKAIKMKPDDVEGYIILGSIFRNSEQYAKEIMILLDILSKFKDQKYSVLCKISEAYSYNGQMKEAEQTAKKAIKMKPGDIDGYYSLWFTYNESNQYTKEITILLDILSKFKDQKYSVLCKLSMVYSRSGQMKKAEQTAKKAIKMKPDDIKGYIFLCSVYRNSEQYAKEIMILLDILSKFKDQKYSVLCKISEAYSYNGQMKEAEQTAKKAIKTNPDDIQGYILLCSVYRNSEQYAKEITIFLDILSKFKDSKYSVLCKLSVAYLHNGQMKEAEQTAKKAIKMKPDDIDGYHSLWFTYNESNQYAKEIMILLDILSKFSDYAYSILCKISVAYSYNGQMKEAEQTAKKAIKTNPDDIKGYILLCSVYRNSEQYTKEITILLDILSKFSDYAYSILCKISEAYSYNGQMKEAEQTAKKAIKTNPDGIMGYISLCSIFRKIEQHAKEIEILSDILPKFRDYNYSILMRLAKAHLLNKQFEEAKESADKAARIKKSDSASKEILEKIFDSKEKDYLLTILRKSESYTIKRKRMRPKSKEIISSKYHK